MSTTITTPERTAAAPRHGLPAMEIRGWWGLLTVVFYPALAIQLLVPWWPQIFGFLAGLAGPDPFPLYVKLSMASGLLLVVIVATGIARALVASAGIYMRHQRVKEFFRTTEIPNTVIKDRLTALQAYDIPFVVYGDPVPRAFVLGIIRPRIYLSTALLDALSDQELGSVIMHEVHHYRNKDPQKGFMLSILSHLFFYVPVIRHYAEFWQQHREWEADAAAKRVSNATSLAEALCKLLVISPHVSSAGGFAIAGKSAGFATTPALHGMGNVRERIELLLDLKEPRDWKLTGREFVISAANVFLLALLVLGLFPPVEMRVEASDLPAARVDAHGWVTPERFDDFWVPPFQTAERRVRFVGQGPNPLPPPSHHVLLP